MKERLKLLIIDDEWKSRKEVYENVLNSGYEILAVEKPSDLIKTIDEVEVDGYLIDIVLDQWVTESREPQKLIPILERLKNKDCPVILISRNYNTLVSNNQLTPMINDIIEKDLHVKSFFAWSDFEKENRYLTEGLIESKIQTAIEFCLLSNKKVEDRKKEKDADIGIVCALKEELTPFLDNFSSAEIEKISFDNISCRRGVLITKNGKQIKFVTAFQEEMGTVDAAIIGTILAKEFNVKHLFMIGVCGGRDGKVKIGDIVIPSQSVAYQRGKLSNEGLKLAVGYSQTNINPRMIFDGCDQIVKEIQKKYVTKRMDKGEEGLAVKIPEIHFDPIACGDNVLDKDDELKKISQNVAQRKLCAIDMESYGILRLNKFLGIKTIVIKSVMDLTENKSDAYKEYASYIAGNFLFEILQREIYDHK